MSVLTDGEAVSGVIAFTPPAVEDAEIQTAVAAGFHATRARSFQRSARVVKPNVAPGDHLPGDVHIIVFDKNEISLQIAIFAAVNDVLDIALAIIVPRMSLASENKLHRSRFVAGEFYDVFELLKNQGRAFVSGKPAGKPDRQ